MDNLQPGQEIVYRTYDSNANEKWNKGIIHGVRTYERNGLVRASSYLVDTGKSIRIDKHPFDQRDREVNNRIQKMVAKGADNFEAIKKASNATDLPPSKLEYDIVRQPEQIEVSPEHIKAQ